MITPISRNMHRLRRTAGHFLLPVPTAGGQDDGSDVATATADVANGARRAHSPGAVPDPRADPEWLDRIYALHELVPMAKAKLTKQDWEFMRGGADAEASIRRNRLELDSLVRPSNPPLLAIYGDVLFSFTPSRDYLQALRPSMLEDVSSIDLSTTLFGGELSFPIITAPMGGATRWDAEGAQACARAASTSGVMSCLSSLADGLLPGPTSILENNAACCSGPKIFQLYIRGDDDYVDDHAARAIAAGYNAFAITVDVQLISRREGMITSRYQARAGSASGGIGGLDHQSRFGWASLARFKKKWPDIPLLVKGIMTAVDASRCVDMGCHVWVSNHGGRQLDQAQGTMAVLPEIVKAVDGRMKIVVDGGFLRGTDVVKAMALGADAVALGRLVAVSLSAGGEQGLVRALDLLLEETHTVMGLMSKRNWAELKPEDVVAAPYAAAGPPDLFSGFPYLQTVSAHKQSAAASNDCSPGCVSYTVVIDCECQMDSNFGQMRW